MKIGIIVAMDKEFAQLKTLLSDSKTEHRNHKDFVTGTIGDNEVIMQQCGIGKVNSAIGAVEMIDGYHPDLVISTGVAGGADISLNITEVVVSTECVYHDAYCGEECVFGQILGMPATFATPSEYVEKALSVNDDPGNIHPKIHAGQIVSGEWFVDSKEKMRSILDHFPQAMAVDMESCSIAQTCHIRLPSSPSASSAMCLSRTPRLSSTSTSGPKWLKVPSKSPRLSWKDYKKIFLELRN